MMLAKVGLIGRVGCGIVGFGGMVDPGIVGLKASNKIILLNKN